MGIRDFGRLDSTLPADRAHGFACDADVSQPRDEYWRAIDVDAPPSVVFRWLCQLRVAPYSYDLIDNFGRRSPRELTPGLDKPEVGDRVMTIFRITAVTPGEQLTFAMGRSRVFGRVSCSYRVVPCDRDTASRIAVKVVVSRDAGPVAFVRRALLPWGDLVMMRKQLRTLRDLAERHAG